MADLPRINSIADFVDPNDLTQTENLELLARHIVDGFLSGRHRSRLKGGCAEFAEHRAYCPGDEIRLLDWRVFGKSDRYCIKQFEEETSLQAILVLDASGSMGFGLETMSKYDYARRAALCLARLVLLQRDAAGLAVIGGGVRSYVPPRSTPRHLEVLVENLRAASPSGPTSLSADLAELAPRIKRRGLIALFSDCFDGVDQLARSLRLLRSRRHEVLLFHVMAPEELSFSFRQWTRFESLEQPEQALDLDPAAIRGDYLARLKAFLGQVRNACGELGCDYFPMVTDKPLGDTLANHLRRRAASLK
jgi:uncharacterized protein (DUF58 family)